MELRRSYALVSIPFVAIGLLHALPAQASDKVLRSSQAVVDSVKTDSPSAKAGLKVGDVITTLNGNSKPSLEMLFSYRFDWAQAKDSVLGLHRSGEVRLPQGEWGCEFAPDLPETARKHIQDVRALLQQPASWQQGVASWTGLAEEMAKEGFFDAAAWLGLELGGALIAARHFPEAQKTLKIWEDRALPGSYWRFAALLKQAQALRGAGEPDRALETIRRAQALARESGAELRLASALVEEAGLEKARGRLLESRQATEAALEIRNRRVPGTLSSAETLMRLGSVIEELGDLETGKAHLLQAEGIKKRLAPGSESLAKTYNDLGGIAWKQGDLATTRNYLLQALLIYQERSPNSWGVAAIYANLGNVCHTQGDLPAAKEYFQRSLGLFEHLSPGGRECGAVLNNLGTLALEIGDLASARIHLQKSLSIQERLLPGSLNVARILNNLGQVAVQQGDLPAGKDHLSKSLELRERLAPGSLDEALSLTTLGNVAIAQQDFQAGRKYHGRALAIRERLAPGGFAMAETLRNLARTEALAGEPEGRLAYLARAVDALEAQRSRSGGEAAKTSFSAANGGFYSDLIAAQLDAKQPERALETLERSRGRALLELVSTRLLDFGTEIPKDLLARQKALEGQRKTLSDALAQSNGKTNPKDIETWRSELLMLPQREDALAEEIRKASPRLAALSYPKPLDFRGMAAALEPGTLLVAFAVAETESFLFTLQGGNAVVKAYRLPVGEKALAGCVKGFRELLGAQAALGSDANAWKNSALELYKALLAPASREIAGSQRILLMPDGPLHLLPFDALIPGGKGALSLGLSKPISIAASMTIHAGLKAGHRTEKRSLSWTGFGDPLYPDQDPGGGLRQGLRTRGFQMGPLPGTREEILGIAALFGGRATIHLGAEASKEAVRALPRNLSYLHFACHGFMDPDFPMNSALALSSKPGVDAAGKAHQDGFLSAWEIMRDVRLDSDCVVLSACETGVGKVFGGEGILGLTRAFFYAGVRSVVVSLWPISDESSSLFMEAFYREILAGASRDVALQRARKSLARSRDFAHPFHWAAFELHGVGR